MFHIGFSYSFKYFGFKYRGSINCIQDYTIKKNEKAGLFTSYFLFKLGFEAFILLSVHLIKKLILSYIGSIQILSFPYLKERRC